MKIRVKELTSKIMRNIETKYIVIVIVAVILSGSYMIGQSMKQNSIEKQQQLEIEAEQELIKLEGLNELAEKEAEEAQRSAEITRYLFCKDRAIEEYWSYVELNGTVEDGVVEAETWIWDEAKKDKQQRIENCKDLYLE